VALPNVNTFSMSAAASTLIANQSTIINANGSAALLTTTLGAFQRRIVLSFGGNEAANTFVVTGTNQAGMRIVENVAGVSTGSTFTNLDFFTVNSIVALATTAATVQAGTNTTGSTLWNIMNWHATPTNIECSGVVTSTSTAVTWGVQYCYDDPNNLQSGVQFPQPFNHPTLVSLTTSQDGPINDPVTGVRFTISAGTGTIRGTVIQAGIRGS